jgi:ribosome-associated protein
MVLRYHPGMLFVNSHIQIPENELTETFIRSSGPGGQNVNKVASAVQLRYDAEHSDVLSGEVKQRLLRLAGSRATSEGMIVIIAKRYRDQEKNRADARERLAVLIRRAMERPKPRKRTHPSRASVQKRLEEKKQRGEKKILRRKDWLN